MADQIMQDIQIETKANVYFDGRVTSRTGYRKDGSKFTLGIITAGSYAFDVGEREFVQLIAGSAEILLPNESEWRTVTAPQTFEIIADCSYQIRTDGIVEYLCDYDKD